MAIKDLVIQKPRFNALVKKLRGGTSLVNGSFQQQIIQLTGLKGSAAATFLAPLKNALPGLYLFVMDDEETAGYFFHDLCSIVGEEGVLFFPSGYKRSIKYGQVDAANEILRTEAIGKISAHKSVNGPLSITNSISIVTYPEALAEKVAQSEEVEDKLLILHKGEKAGSSQLIQILNDEGFQRVDYVYEPGQFAVRGSIVDVFSYTSEYPFRIDFFDDEIDSLRSFEVDTQLSRETLDEITIAPSFAQTQAKGISLAEFLPEETVIICNNPAWTTERIEQLCQTEMSQQLLMSEEGDIHALDKLVNPKSFAEAWEGFTKVCVTDQKLSIINHQSSIIDHQSSITDHQSSIINHQSSINVIAFHTTAQPSWHKNFDLISADFRRYQTEGYTLHILSDSPKQLDRIDAIFADRGESFKLIHIEKAIHEGFVDDDTRQCYFTDHQIFDRYHRYNLKSDRARSGKIALSLKELKEYNIGDYIVHVDHGIARFGGLVMMPIGKDPATGQERMQEVVKLVYKDNAMLFVSIHQLDRLSKYRGREGEPPTLSNLNNNAWEKLRDRTKEKMKDMARDLIQLYARRREQKGYHFAPDGQLQHELEASFIYEDTPDQLKATIDVKRDMESEKPMDRLICGDVGFGKTEVAIRAALKACNDCKQVAVLVPTTVLAFQHYKTFSERLKDFPVRIDYLTRARTAKQTAQIVKDLANGEINIIIGTHKLIGKSIKFQDLGLLVIDEEQKFGVKTKEALKQLRVNVDTLTMTATPIPRTLQFSLMGARDLSIIATPPPNRYPIQTEVHRDGDDILREAINFELSRNGQVFFIHNRISQLPNIAERIQRLVPDARVAFGHGQMEPEKTEQLIMDFANHEFDVLICTTIIEAGLDIPNANTMIVSQAQNYGLSELHQLRGRVGRTNRKAFCYLLCPPLSTLTQEARRRLQAIETYSDLGSGIQIAMQDLDIRGAGNLLGGEQSGFISDLGYEAYQKILKQAVHELKTQEFADLYAEERDQAESVVEDCNLETDLDICFGEKYVPESSERIALYQELDSLTSEAEVEAYRTRLVDRFGRIPESGEELIRVVELRRLGRQLGFEKIVMKQGDLHCYLPLNNPDYYQSDVFERVINFYSSHAQRCKLESKNGRRSLNIATVRTIKGAITLLKKI